MSRVIPSPGTPQDLPSRLRQRIERDGPISFRDWMHAALYDEHGGYYCTQRLRQGRAGDYRTAPETSPLFAATFARYFAKLFVELGSPARLTIVEAGAGSGAFAHGVLSSLKLKWREVFEATAYIIVELGIASRERCVTRLAEFSDRVTVTTPIGSEGRLPNQSFFAGKTIAAPAHIVFSNELIDAFPVHRVTVRNGKLRELGV